VLLGLLDYEVLMCKVLPSFLENQEKLFSEILKNKKYFWKSREIPNPPIPFRNKD